MKKILSIYKIYKLANKIYEYKVPLIPKVIQILLRIVFSCDIPYTARIGKGTRFAHAGLGTVLHRRTVIGENCTIYQHVTIGGNGSKTNNGVPLIGDNVKIFTGAVVIGPISIGDDAIIAANSVVTQDVLAGDIVGGIPAKSVKKKE